MYRYNIYGLSLDSTHKLFSLQSSPKFEKGDIQVVFNVDDTFHGPKLPRDCMESGFDLLEDGLSSRIWFRSFLNGWHQSIFDINSDYSEISISGTDIYHSWLSSLLVGPVLACVLRLRGNLALHGAVVYINGKTVCFLGASGRGKSTLASAMTRFGGCVISDDVVAVRQTPKNWIVHPGNTLTRLLPQSAKAVGITKINYGPLDHTDEKGLYQLSSSDASDRRDVEGQPVDAFFLLNPRNHANILQVRQIDFKERVMRLMAERSFPKLRLSRQGQSQELYALSNLAKDIPVFALDRPEDLSALDKVCEVVLEAISEVQSSDPMSFARLEAG